MVPVETLPDRLRNKILITETCWLWLGARGKKGYACTKWKGRQPVVHRVVYELLVGAVPEGLELDHLCRVRHCVNPAHLEPVTHLVNLVRGTGFVAENAKKTHCEKGHPFNETNTTFDKDGGRHCYECHKESQRKRYNTDEYRAWHAAYTRKKRQERRRAA